VLAVPALTAVAEWAFLVSMVVFVVWFYRARINAEGRGWRQRTPAGQTTGAWSVPVLNLWFRGD